MCVYYHEIFKFHVWNVYKVQLIFFTKKFSSMALKSHLVFVYGTLKKGEPNFDLLKSATKGEAIYKGKARTVKKWPLVIASRFNIPFLLYQEDVGKHVIGELYQVDDSMLTELDILECHPKYYTRMIESVELITNENEPSEGKILKSWIYFLKNFRPELLELPHLEEYSSKGPHGLEYVSSEDTSDPEDIYETSPVEKV
ncbi:Gamma-glutamylaminecyclotransferase, partial [Stegodyphus mimosarum]